MIGSVSSPRVSIDELQLRVVALQSENVALGTENSTLRGSLGPLRAEVERLQRGIEGPTGMVNRATAVAATISRKLLLYIYMFLFFIYIVLHTSFYNTFLEQKDLVLGFSTAFLELTAQERERQRIQAAASDSEKRNDAAPPT